MRNPVTLNVYRGEDLVRTERFTRDIIKIGRLSSAHLCLEDDRVSRIHSVIEVAPDGHVSIIDMGSAEGTFVNGKRVSKGPLRPGDEIKLGGLRIVFDGVDARPSATPRTLHVAVADGASAGGVRTNGNGSGAWHAPVWDGNGASGYSNGHAVASGRSPARQPAAGAQTAPPIASTAAPAAPRADTRAPGGHGIRSAELVNGSTHRAPPPARAVRAASAAAGGAAPALAEPAPTPVPANQGPRSRRPSLALTRPIEDEPVEPGAPELGVELRVIWGDTLLDAGTFVAPKHPVLLGESPRCHFRLSGPALPGDEFPILRHEGGEYRFAFARGMSGALDENGATRTFAQLLAASVATPEDGNGIFSVAVPRAGAVHAQLGSGLRVEARYRRPPPAAVVPWWEKIDYRYLNLLVVLLFLQGAFIVAAKTTTRDVDLLQDDLAKGQQRLAKFVVKPPEAQPKPNPYLEKLKADAKKDPGELAERHRNEEGKMGKRDAPKNDHRSAPRAIDPNAKELVKSSGLLAAIGKGKGMSGLSTVFGQGGLGGDLKGAIGNMYGPVVGDSYGVGGLGLKGNGTGGGGGGDTIGIGAVGTKGRGGGLGGYGSGVGGLGAKRDREIAIATGETRVLGAIDPELVRKVIRDHADQVRYCYEQQLTINPKLGGKVAIKWQIGPDGSASSTMVDPANPLGSDAMRHVAECVMARIRTWEFPKPKGGGVAIVTYPWILRSAGSTAGG